MAVVFGDDELPPGDAKVVVHMGAGVVENAVDAALRNHDDYRTPSRAGAFCVSVFCATGGVSVDEIIGTLPHSYPRGQRYSRIRASRLASPADRAPMRPDIARGKVTCVIDGKDRTIALSTCLTPESRGTWVLFRDQTRTGDDDDPSEEAQVLDPLSDGAHG